MQHSPLPNSTATYTQTSTGRPDMISVRMSRVMWSQWIPLQVCSLSQDSSSWQRMVRGLPVEFIMLEIVFEIYLYPDATLNDQQVQWTSPQNPSQICACAHLHPHGSSQATIISLTMDLDGLLLFSCLCSSPFHYSSPSRVIICLATACFKSSNFSSSAEKSQLLTQVDKMSAYSGVCLHL